MSGQLAVFTELGNRFVNPVRRVSAWAGIVDCRRRAFEGSGLAGGPTWVALGVLLTLSVAAVCAECPCSTSTMSLVIPAAVLSPNPEQAGCLMEIYWGGNWSRGDMILVAPISSKYPSASADPWYHGISESMAVFSESGNVRYADGLSFRGISPTPLPPGHLNYYQPFKYLAPDNERYFNGYRNTFYQHQSLNWPSYDYESMKAFMLRRGYPMYRAAADGRIYDPTDPWGPPRSFSEIFNRAGSLDPDEIDRDACPPIYFIDTYDGLPPQPDGSNLPTIQISSLGPFFYGLFFIADNVDFVGSGDSPTYDFPVMPDDSVSTSPIINCRLMGLFYGYGKMEFQGEGSIYGALVAERGFLGGGNWDIHYDASFADPARCSLSSTLHLVSHEDTVQEESQTWSIPVGMDFYEATTVTLRIRVSGGTAMAGEDYEITNDTITLAPGETEGFFEVTVFGDLVREENETIVLSLVDPCCALLGEPSEYTLTLLDYQPPPDYFIVY